MPARVRKAILATLLLAAGSWGSAGAQTMIKGQIGADLGSYSFSNFIVNEDVAYSVDRRISNQFADLTASGPLANGYFANYGLNLRLSATQVRASDGEESTTDFIKPALTNYYGNLGLFPQRRLPIGLHFGRKETYSIRYEQNNKGEIDVVDPGLAVLRRYKSVTEGKGIDVAYSASPALAFNARYSDDQVQLVRQYDFDENRNIWVDFSPLNPGLGPYYDVEVINTIPDRDVLLYVDEAFVDTVRAGQSLEILLEEGLRRIELAPVGLNPFRTTQNIDANMVWRIYFNEPPGAKDSHAFDKNLVADVAYDAGGAFTDDFSLNVTDGREEVQDIETGLLTATNKARYKFSGSSAVNLKTSLAINNQKVGVLSDRENRTFTNLTEGLWGRPYGVQLRAAHRLIDMESNQDGVVTATTSNMLDGFAAVPTHWYEHVASLRLNADLARDNIASGHKTYQGELGNTLRFRKGGFLWTPTQSLRLLRGWTEKSDSRNRELESKLGLKSERRDWGPVGDVIAQVDWNWRSLTNETRRNTKDTLGANLNMERRFGETLALGLRFGVKREAFGASVVDGGSDTDLSPPQDDTNTRDLGATLRATPWKSFSFMAMLTRNKSNEAENTTVAGTVSWRLPAIGAPLRARYSRSERLQAGRPPQTDVRAKVTLSQAIRKIELALTYDYTDSDGPAEHYSYNEFTATVTRAFDIK